MCFRQTHHNNDLFNLFCSSTQPPYQRPVFVDVVSNTILVAPFIVQFHSICRFYVKSPMMLPTDCSVLSSWAKGWHSQEIGVRTVRNQNWHNFNLVIFVLKLRNKFRIPQYIVYHWWCPSLFDDF